MKHATSPTFSGKTLNTGYSQPDTTTVVVGLSSRKKSETDFSDPYEVQKKFPELWREYLHAHYRNYMDVARNFGVCEKAARKWWDGIGGPRGGMVAIAMRKHPETAAIILFPEAGE